MKRREFVVGNVMGLVAGVAGLATSGCVREQRAAASPAQPCPEPEPRKGKVSYAQQGEDLIIQNVFDIFKIQRPSYLDIGAFDPIVGSNTYLLYLAGSRGVLVEPNPAGCAKLRAVRPGDVVVNAGIGPKGGAPAVDYYIIEGDGQLNTFSKEQVAALEKEGAHVKEVVKMPLVDINDVIAKNFTSAPDLVSIDAEGMDLTILEGLDFARWRPKIFCVETAVMGSGTVEPNPKIVELMKSHEYSIRGGNIVNSVFLDNRVFR